MCERQSKALLKNVEHHVEENLLNFLKSKIKVRTFLQSRDVFNKMLPEDLILLIR